VWIEDAEAKLWRMATVLDAMNPIPSPEADDLKRRVDLLRAIIIEARLQRKNEIDLPPDLLG